MKEGMKKVTIMHNVMYVSHVVKDNGIVKLTLKSTYNNLMHTIHVLQMLNNDITIQTKLDNNVYNLGSYRVDKVNIDSDGESKIVFITTVDYANLDKVNTLAVSARDKEIRIRMIANIEKEVEESETR